MSLCDRCPADKFLGWFRGNPRRSRPENSGASWRGKIYERRQRKSYEKNREKEAQQKFSENQKGLSPRNVFRKKTSCRVHVHPFLVSSNSQALTRVRTILRSIKNQEQRNTRDKCHSNYITPTDQKLYKNNSNYQNNKKAKWYHKI